MSVLNFLIVPTYNTNTLGVADTSVYEGVPTSPTVEITVPSFGKITLPFVPNDFNVFNSTSLGITQVGDDLLPLPDGIYTIKYSIYPAYTNFVEHNMMRVDQLQEKYDEAFMKLDMMQCDKSIKTQAKVELSSIYFFIQGSIAAANKCAPQEANKLYATAKKMLINFGSNGCNCSGSNYISNF